MSLKNYIEVKKIRIFLLVAAAVLSLGSCTRKTAANRELLLFVRQALSDSAGTFPLIKAYNEKGSAGTIAVIGEPEEAILLAEHFVSVDRMNNIDGKEAPDGLPDFSGETFDVIMDSYDAPYVRFIGGDTDSLREATVRGVLFALDTTCLVTPYSFEVKKPKTPSKVFVLASSLATAYGRHDVDTLFRLAGLSGQVVSTADASMAAAFKGEGPRNVVVWADSDVALSSTYDRAFQLYSKPGSSVSVLSPDGGGDASARLRSLLTKYLRSGKPMPLNALILDDFGVDTDFLNDELQRIRQKGTDEDIVLSKVVAPDFQIIDPLDETTEACYRLLRRENRFTHNIAYPKARFYEVEESIDGYPVLTGVSNRYMASEIGDFVDVNTVAIRPFYVSE